MQFIATPLNLRLVAKHKDNPSGIDLGPWFKSLDQATETGATFSHAVPITPEDGANEVGQVYQGPVVLVTDARCYSATDIFAAGFQDHEIGPVLGVDDNTGAGGANVWTHALLKQLSELPTPDANSPYKTLPQQANMRVSIRRTLRVGAQSGTPLEDLGVVPNVRHRMTRDDLLAGNKDLLDRAGALLAAMPVRRLDIAAVLDARRPACRPHGGERRTVPTSTWTAGHARPSTRRPARHRSPCRASTSRRSYEPRASPTGSWSRRAPSPSRTRPAPPGNGGRPVSNRSTQRRTCAARLNGRSPTIDSSRP